MRHALLRGRRGRCLRRGQALPTLQRPHGAAEPECPCPSGAPPIPARRSPSLSNGQTKSATADATGKWTVRLTKLKSGGPFEMTIAGKKPGDTPSSLRTSWSAKSGSAPASRTCSFTSQRTAPATRPTACSTKRRRSPPRIIRNSACSPSRTRRPTTADPTSSASGRSAPRRRCPTSPPSAISSARDLNQALKLPVGIVLSAFGASTAEAWVPRDALAADPLLKPMLDKLDAREDYFKAIPRDRRRRSPVAPDH